MTEKELEREIKNKQRRISLEEKHENFIAVVRKMKNTSGHQGENERQRKKKVNRNTYNISSIKPFTRKFLEVSRYSRAEQGQRNVLKKCAARAKLFFC